jgi:heat-inducible transcriptional repressor
MGVLEKSGLLYQPHISAGRVPSDSGYRVYVDRLITPCNELHSQVEHLLSDRLDWDSWGLESLLRGAAQILATVSGYITLITLPQARTACLRHVQLVPVDARRVMLIFVTDSYETQSVLMDLPQDQSREPIDAELLERELQILSNFLSSQLRGRAIAELTHLDWSELDQEFQRYSEFLRLILAELHRRSQAAAPTQIVVSGLAEVLRQPEFSQLQQVQTIVQLLEEEQEQIVPLIFEQVEGEAAGSRVSIRIGAENPLEPFRTCTLISATYRRGTMPVGSVGVLGPTRMVYENAIALVETAADYLSEAVSRK